MHKFAFAMVSVFMNMLNAEQTLFLDFNIVSDGVLKKENAVLIEDGRIKAIGTSQELTKLALKKAKKIVGNKAFLMPGFIESHGHLLSTGFALMNADIRGKSLLDIEHHLKTLLSEKNNSAPLYGRGWDQNLWADKQFPTHELLDQVSKTVPIYLKRVDGHALWVNKKAMDLAKIDHKVKDISGGTIIKNAQGKPTGVFIDRAMDLFESQHQHSSPEYLTTAINKAIEKAHQYGITSFHDAGTQKNVLDILKQLARTNKLRLRLYVMLDGDDDELIEQYLKSGPTHTDLFLSIRSIKYFLDGALGSRGALLLAPYHDDQTTSGLILKTPEAFFKQSNDAINKGFQVGVHAIGDKANRIALDTFQKLKDYPNARLRIEHAQLIDPADHARFQKLNVIASMQPIHGVSDSLWVGERLGTARLSKRAYPWRSLLDHQAIIAFGSDTPVESMNPLLGLHAAITRTNTQGHVFMKEERIKRTEALKAYQEHAAYAEFSEHQKGKIALGYLADFVVYDKNILTIPENELLSLTPKMTIVHGQIVFKR